MRIYKSKLPNVHYFRQDASKALYFLALEMWQYHICKKNKYLAQFFSAFLDILSLKWPKSEEFFISEGGLVCFYTPPPCGKNSDEKKGVVALIGKYVRNIYP